VVVSAGAVNSPQLLLLSGIGPAAQLSKLDIPVVVNAPAVGQNLQDHLLFGVAYECKIPTITPAIETIPNFIKWNLLGSGPLTSTGLEGSAFMSTGVRPDLKVPDMQIHFIAAGGSKELNNFNLMEDRMLMAPGFAFTFLPVLLHPRSTGSVTLRSRDPFDPPRIDPRYLTHEDDVSCILAGVRVCQKIAQQKAFEGVVGKSLSDMACKFTPPELKHDTDEWWSWMIRATALTCYHPVGTCKMGTDPKTGAVVDPTLKVFGVRGLRVADCSILPTLPSGNTNAPAIMVGEKCADLILRELRGQ